MKGISICEYCKKEFEWERFKNQTIAKFCSKKCWYESNAEKMRSFNEKRFQWNTATEEEQLKKLKENFEEKVIRKDGCWDWIGVRDKDGYGVLPSGYHKQSKAHRVSWLIHKGEIPNGLIVCHNCDNPPCCNPEHLFLGNKKDNAMDMANKFRGTCGRKNKHCKLTEEDVKKIRILIEMGVTLTRISKDFNISLSRVSDIKNRRTWKHI